MAIFQRRQMLSVWQVPPTLPVRDIWHRYSQSGKLTFFSERKAVPHFVTLMCRAVVMKWFLNKPQWGMGDSLQAAF